MADENIKALIKHEYENGSSIRVLAEKYNQKVGTIKSWLSRERWIKKKENTATSRKRNATKKRNQLRAVANDKKTKMKTDILDGIPKEMIKAEHGISERTYYRAVASVRQIQIERSERVLEEIAKKRYSDAEERLIKISEKKKEIEDKIINSDSREEIREYLDKLKALREIEKDIKSGARTISDYRMAELEQQLENEKILRERIELEKSKNKEIETVDLTIVEDYK